MDVHPGEELLAYFDAGRIAPSECRNSQRQPTQVRATVLSIVWNKRPVVDTMNTATLKFLGMVSEISRPGLYCDQMERITVSVAGAEPLYAELRLPNTFGWEVGQRVVVMIVTESVERDNQAAA